MFARQELVFDDFVYGTTPVYTSQAWAEFLALYDRALILCLPTDTSGGPGTYTLDYETSPNGVDWTKSKTVASLPLTDGVLDGGFLRDNRASKFARLKLTLASATSSRLRVWLAASVDAAECPLPFHELMFDDDVSDQQYTSQAFAEKLASSESFCNIAVVQNVVGAATQLTLDYQTSPDVSVGWASLTGPVPFALSAGSTNVVQFTYYSSSFPPCKFGRLGVQISGPAPASATVRLYVTGRTGYVGE